ncbi:MAG TPA: cytochrome c-type biogenesis protein [Marinobacter sp.]|uniref:cytochrome c-type biogenesis protein n=1 Tax=Marinobacter sp. TaxID=50741 RepID=UPI00261A1B71|nr:cytochrome c-type biogenesis protein [Marinobacter sp.]HET8799703.1 cytochrome c-type biogenesis protein [Marinobacter sp.]
MIRVISVVAFLALSGLAMAQVADVYEFNDPSMEARYRALTAELRCPKCQNQNIADSDAPIASDMRDEVYRMMQSGASDDAIVDSLVARFGEFVRYKPELDQRTFLLWATPAIAVVGGLLVVAGVIIRSRGRNDRPAALSADEKARAERLLASQDHDTTS